MSQIKDSEIVLKGFTWVNLPVIIIIFSSLFLILSFTDLNFNKSVIVAGAIGWIYWEIAVMKWIKWALKNQVEKDKLFKLGQKSFLLWSRKKIDKAEIDLNKLSK
jgi:hypothetical protein